MNQYCFPNLSYSIKDKYPSTVNNDGWGMDETHVMILYNLLFSYPYKRVLEIGSHRGFSTTAFLEAIHNGCSFEVHLCDIDFKPSVYEICKGYHQVHLHKMRSVDFLATAKTFDFVLLDGSHISEDVEDEFEYLSMNDVQTLLLHDTCTQLLPQNQHTPWFDGPMLLKHKLLASPDWLCVEDALFREGEQTERGLFLATKVPYIYNQAIRIFENFKLNK